VKRIEGVGYRDVIRASDFRLAFAVQEILKSENAGDEKRDRDDES